MKFYSLKKEIITIAVGLETAKRCHYLSVKSKHKSEKKQPEEEHKVSEVNLDDLDARHDQDSLEDEQDDQLTRELKKRIKRPEPKGEFIEVPLGDDPDKTMKLGVDLPDELERSPIACLLEHANLFAWCATDMPEIPFQVACPHLSLNLEAKWVAQRRLV